MSVPFFIYAPEMREGSIVYCTAARTMIFVAVTVFASSACADRLSNAEDLSPRTLSSRNSSSQGWTTTPGFMESQIRPPDTPVSVRRLVNCFDSRLFSKDMSGHQVAVMRLLGYPDASSFETPALLPEEENKEGSNFKKPNGSRSPVAPYAALVLRHQRRRHTLTFLETWELLKRIAKRDSKDSYSNGVVQTNGMTKFADPKTGDTFVVKAFNPSTWLYSDMDKTEANQRLNLALDYLRNRRSTKITNTAWTRLTAERNNEMPALPLGAPMSAAIVAMRKRFGIKNSLPAP